MLNIELYNGLGCPEIFNRLLAVSNWKKHKLTGRRFYKQKLASGCSLQIQAGVAKAQRLEIRRWSMTTSGRSPAYRSRLFAHQLFYDDRPICPPFYGSNLL